MSNSTMYPAEWLSLREDADAVARSVELAEPLRAHLGDRPGLIVRDLGCGIGSMGRWLADRLPGPQHWILHDRDPGLLSRAVAGMPRTVTVTGELQDITQLRATDLSGTSLVTASALLDLLTADELAALVEACARTPALFVMSVVGQVDLDPFDEFDAEIANAFNAHQRRTTDGRRLLGPDAVATAAELFQRQGATVYRRPSPWRLGRDDADLIAEWLRGWVAAAVEEQPELADDAAAYLERRLGDTALTVVVHHEDLLALPAGAA
ncbi:class I SAM-dependent methyltransferase [Kibdelosporangium phytohabitans]|uniref:Trans-aconitate methyltransferase n=1 Tax=Kibdelosporangium phytohabitans TaxID=860235 RepID=A0A0N9I9Y4_9PSEU|nr:class I SAM-dependent methyltransferase [Kibdelosporangium phytohabitans]ALG11282.1 trans-aconitate methyltransferase [Kibdelosporangium phytohabitans]MBE1462572.1 trans-aconitate methyltransferase [Kibdelosporangium phytohabitans]